MQFERVLWLGDKPHVVVKPNIGKDSFLTVSGLTGDRLVLQTVHAMDAEDLERGVSPDQVLPRYLHPDFERPDVYIATGQVAIGVLGDNGTVQNAEPCIIVEEVSTSVPQ